MAPGRLVGILVVAIAAVVVSACDRKAPPPPDEPPLPPKSLALDAGVPGTEAADRDAGDGAEAARRLVSELRGQKLDVAARRVAPQRIVFGKAGLAQLGETELVVREVPGFKVKNRLAVDEPRKVVALDDGSLLCATKNELVRVGEDPKKTQRFKRVPLFPDSLLFADRRYKDQLWVLHGIDPTLYPYHLGESSSLETLDFVELADFDQKGFAALKDGSFVYTAGNRLRRFFAGGKSWNLELPEGAEVWRVLTTRRVDQAFIARGDGKVQLVQLAADRLTLVKTLDLPGAFDIASNDSELAILRLDSAKPGPDGGAPGRAWMLAVFDSNGKEQMRVDLPLDAPSGSDEDWVRDITKNRAVVLSSHAPVVAVGGPTWLAAWSTKTGERLLSP